MNRCWLEAVRQSAICARKTPRQLECSRGPIARTLSPSFFCQLATLPMVIVGDSDGISSTCDGQPCHTVSLGDSFHNAGPLPHCSAKIWCPSQTLEDIVAAHRRLCVLERPAVGTLRPPGLVPRVHPTISHCCERKDLRADGPRPPEGSCHILPRRGHSTKRSASCLMCM